MQYIRHIFLSYSTEKCRQKMGAQYQKQYPERQKNEANLEQLREDLFW